MRLRREASQTGVPMPSEKELPHRSEELLVYHTTLFGALFLGVRYRGHRSLLTLIRLTLTYESCIEEPFD
jgi:hypothetical protein